MDPISFSQTRGPSSTDHIVVFLDDTQHTQLRATRLLTNALASRGDVVTAHYNRQTFDARMITNMIALEVAGFSHRKITFIGSLAGALLSHDVIAKLKQAKIEKEYRLVFIQTPIDAVRDLRSLVSIRTHAWRRYITQHSGTQKNVLAGVPLISISTAGQRSVMPAKWSRTPAAYPRIVTKAYEDGRSPRAAADYWERPIIRALDLLDIRS